jgi:DNA-binding response OmpR family regulator
MSVSRSASTKEKMLRVILVEDDNTYAEMVRRLLITKFELLHAKTLSELLDLGRHQEPDVILLDLGLPDGGDYISLVMKVVGRFRESAVIVTTGLDDEMLALEAMRAGAQDYLVKEMYVRDQMIRKIVHAHARHAAATRAAESTAALAAAASSSSMHITAVDPDMLTKKLEEMVERILNDKVLSKHHVRPRTDVFEPVPHSFNLGDFLNQVIKDNWKFISSVIAMVTIYVTDFRDTVRETADAVEYNAAAVQQTAKATKDLELKTRKENKQMREGLIYTLVTTMKATEHLQLMIEAAAPKVDFPKPDAELREAQAQTKNIEAARALFEEEDLTDAP